MHLDIFKLNMMMFRVFHTAHGYHATKILTNSDYFTRLNETGMSLIGGGRGRNRSEERNRGFALVSHREKGR